jgi:hypothetical protein
MRRTRAAGAVARLRLLERIRLSPEDYDDDEMRRLTRVLLEDGIRIFVFSFHSPSLMPGGTPYVSTEADLLRFLGKCRRYFRFFLNELQGVSMTPIAVKQALKSGSVD